MDFRRDLSRTTTILARASADVIGLQEVERKPKADQAQSLANDLDRTLVWAPSPALRAGSYGNALLVRGIVHQHAVHDLSVFGCERRSCLDAKVETRGVTLRFLVCHFGLGFRERAKQMEQLMAIVRTDVKTPCVLLGDFNEWHAGPVRHALGNAFPNSPLPMRTHPSVWPLFALDRIVWSDALRGTVHVEAVSGASDHCLLRAEVSQAS